jgi:hypothetical protein
LGTLHWLILFPYYFFGALSLLLLMMVVARLLRLKVKVNALVMIAIIVSLVTVAFPLIVGWADIGDYSGRILLLIGVDSFILAAVDAALESRLPLPLDQELQAL